jgi:hypothetical protein
MAAGHSARRRRGAAAAILASALLGGCAAPATAVRPATEATAATAAADRAHTADLAQAVDEALGWLAAADPRLAARASTEPPREVLARIGTEAVLAEDTSARIVGSSLDLFAFRARAHAVEEARKVVSSFHEPLPEQAPVGSAIARPRLEQELLERLIVEERARADEEAQLGDAAGDLVRGLVATWRQPERPQEVQDRDVWVSKHLLEIRDSLRPSGPRTGPPDLDVALYPLERLLAPMQFPRGSAAIAQVRMTMDADMRVVPRLRDAGRLARGTKLHLGLDVDPAALPERLSRLEARLRALATAALEQAGPDGRKAIETRARKLLFAEGPCPAVTDSRVRAMAPPPERAAVCGLLHSLDDEATAPAALVALHDDVLLAFAAVVTTPPPRTGLLSHPDDDDVEALQREARERPIPVLAVALAAELLYPSDAREAASARLAAWRALGEAPLDVVARELDAKP